MPPDKSVQLIVNFFYYFSTKRYVVGTQNHLNETQMIGRNILEILTLKILLIWTMDMTYSLARIRQVALQTTPFRSGKINILHVSILEEMTIAADCMLNG